MWNELAGNVWILREVKRLPAQSVYVCLCVREGVRGLCPAGTPDLPGVIPSYQRPKWANGCVSGGSLPSSVEPHNCSTWIWSDCEAAADIRADLTNTAGTDVITVSTAATNATVLITKILKVPLTVRSSQEMPNFSVLLLCIIYFRLFRWSCNMFSIKMSGQQRFNDLNWPEM